MVATVNELAELGFVERAPDPADRRRNVISLTTAGKRQLRRLERRLAASQDELLAPLSAEERASLTGLLATLLDHHDQRGRNPRGALALTGSPMCPSSCCARHDSGEGGSQQCLPRGERIWQTRSAT